MESKDTSTCKFCLAFTPEQLAQISTQSYKIKKEKHEARKSETATPMKDSTELTSGEQEMSPVSTKRTGKGFSATQHQPANQLVTNRPSSRSPQRHTGLDSSDKGSSASQHQPTNQPATGRDRPSGHVSTNLLPRLKTAGKSHSKQHVDRPLSTAATDTGSPPLHRHRKDSASSDNSGTDSDFSDRPPVDLYAEEGELSDDPELTTEPGQIPSEEQTYRETMKGIREYMGWSDIPDLGSAYTASGDTHFIALIHPIQWTIC